MPLITSTVPVYKLQPDQTGNGQFRVYNFEGTFPDQSDLLLPHRKDHFLFVFVRHANTRQWVDMNPLYLKDNTIYFTGPSNMIVKEEFVQLWSTGVAFTKNFLLLSGNDTLSNLPVLQNPNDAHEILLDPSDIIFIEDILSKITSEYGQKADWQQSMLLSWLTVFLTYLSRLYLEQYPEKPSGEKILLKKYHAKIDECFHSYHEVSDYAGLLNMSPGYLSEVVKVQSGKPAIKHIHERLVLEARRLLLHTENSLKEIAFDLGFNEASYFNRFFKRETGLTPAAYRSEIRKMYH